MKIIDKRPAPASVRFEDLKHGDIFTVSENNSRVGTYIPMMRFDDGPDGPIAICLDNGDWFYNHDAMHLDCVPVETTIVINRNKD